MTASLAHKRILVTGVVDERSIAFAVAERAIAAGATVLLTSPPRDMERTHELASRLGASLHQLDVVDRDDWERLLAQLADGGQVLDGAVHAIAYAPAPLLDGGFAPPAASDLSIAMDTSVTSYAALAQLLAARAPATGASLVGLTFDPSRAWPTYNWMGVLKAALEAANRYVARDMGAARIRSNLVAAGPLLTRAASGIPGFQALLDHWEEAPIEWDPTDAAPVADPTIFLLSDAARAITGEVLHVDAGRHALV